MRAGTTWVALGLLGCGGAAEPAAAARLWTHQSDELERRAAPFAVAASAPHLLVTPLGSFHEPLDVEGVVLSAGRRRHAAPLRLRVPHWRAQHQIALRVGTDRVVVQYDAPAEAAPVEPGEQVRLFAHSMAVGPRLAFSFAVYGEDGRPRMIGLRAGEPEGALLPPGWSVARGPHLAWACGRALRVRGPGGEIVAEPGRSAVAALGARGERYAVDVVASRQPLVACAEPAEEVSVVVRALDGRQGARSRGPL